MSEYNEDEIREKFLNYVRAIVSYWGELPQKTIIERLNGLAFSILAAIDGDAVALPSWILAPLPHEDDKAYNLENNKRYYPENHEINVKCDIAGCLHELYYVKDDPDVEVSEDE